MPNGGVAPFGTPHKKRRYAIPLRGAYRLFLLSRSPAVSVEQKSAWDWCGIINFWKLRRITARQDSGVSKHKGEHSGVFIEEPPRAILTPEKESVRQRGGHFKEPDEPMFTITTQDRRGIIHRGRVRKLTPREFMETDLTQEDEQAEENNMQLGGLNL